MDKLSLKVLRRICKSSKEISKKEIKSIFGNSAAKSLSFLEAEGYIKSGRMPVNFGKDGPVFRSDGIFEPTSKGLDYIEKHPGLVFDRWCTRVCAIWGAVTGTVAIVVEVVLHFR